MKDIVMFIRRFTAPYKWNLVWSVVLNLLTALLTVFSYAFIIPILQMLFGISEQKSYEFMPLGSASLDKVVVNDFYYLIGKVVGSNGPVKALGLLAGVLVAMTLLKVLSAFFSEYFTIGLRNGVVRDMRNTLYDKILSLPIGFFTGERKGDIIARISGDVTEVDASVVQSIYALIKHPIAIVIYLTMMLMVSWQLTVFVLLLLPVIGGLMGLI
ncbi:MAG: ABC transporter ATP-binding protein, partial [Muribaculaceae bacterium]|nr:ABC transporter ATP-binding protein [Muribaculaceae bacterium]